MEEPANDENTDPNAAPKEDIGKPEDCDHCEEIDKEIRSKPNKFKSFKPKDKKDAKED